MNNENQIPPVDKKLMKYAKERVETRSFLKWMLGLGILISIPQTILWFIVGGGETFWPVYFIAGWGLLMLLLCIIFVPSLLGSGRSRDRNDAKIMAEYEKLKTAERQ